MLPFVNPELAALANREDSLIVFPHTQRTGGKALRDKVLAPAFGRDRIYSRTLGTGSRQWHDVTARELTGFRVFTGPFAFADLNKERPTLFIGLVRHPLYRAASLYFYCRNRESHPQHDLALQTTLTEFHHEAVKRNPQYFSNLQCMRLCGKPSAAKAISTVRTHYLGVGATDDVQSFANLLRSVLGWPAVALDAPEYDEARYMTIITREFCDAVLRHNDQDLELFERLKMADFPSRPR